MTDLLVPQDVSGSTFGGGSFNPGAFFQASGAASSTSAVQGLIGSGPWMTEDQSISIKYARVPRGRPQNHTLSLDTYTTSTIVVGTELYAVVDASYSKKKIFAIYTTSSFTQQQTFEYVAASADSRGNTYGGSVNAGSGLGCAGSVLTKQKYYSRRPWDESIDTEVSRQIRGATVAFASSGCGGDVDWGHNQEQHLDNFEWYFMQENWRYTPQTGGIGSGWTAAGDPWAYYARPRYYINGVYHVNKETSPTNVYNFIDDMGWYVNSSQLAKITPTASQNQGYLADEDLLGFSEYDVNRHKYI